MIIVKNLSYFTHKTATIILYEYWFFSYNYCESWDNVVRSADLKRVPYDGTWIDQWREQEVSGLLDAMCQQGFDSVIEGRVPLYQLPGQEPWNWSYSTYIHPVSRLEHLKTLTCWDCSHVPTCPSVWDNYNTDGDCLELM